MHNRLVDLSMMEPETVLEADVALYAALLAWHANQPSDALKYAQRAALLAPSALLPAYAVRFLQAQRSTNDVYAQPEGFTAFIRGGGNVPLYAAVSGALSSVYTDYYGLRLLDIGSGDGMALLPALTPSVAHVTVVEPASEMLATLTKMLGAHGLAHTAFNITLQDFAAHQNGLWELAQATFSLQSLSPADRAQMLPWLREHVGRLLVVEFDVPNLGSLHSPDRAAYMLERYERGLAEYSADRDVVALGFLMPMLFGAFSGDAPPNDEQPISAWVDQLQAVGFSKITQTMLYPYWWADAVLIDAQ